MPSSESAVTRVQFRGFEQPFVSGQVFRRAQREVFPIPPLGVGSSILILRFRNGRRPLA